MSAVLKSVLPDFSDAVKPAAPAVPQAARTTPWLPTRVVKLPKRSGEDAPVPSDTTPRNAMPLAPMTVPDALNALRSLVQTAPPSSAAAPTPVRTEPERPTEDTLSSPWTGLKRSSPTPQAEPAGPAETPEERAAALAEAEARGLEQGLTQARAEAQAQHEAEREAFTMRLAEERARWCEGEAERLADGFSAALRALDADLTQRIGRLLVPVLNDALRRRALDEFSVALGRLLAEPGQAAIRVSGPEDLLDALRKRLGLQAEGVTFEPSAAPEVSVIADQTVLETRLAAWTRLLTAAAEG
ncbi:hypothetical protein [Methylobacterium sp. NFXW15]|uniref:hypothetical protein n=1 Tax=Methylobacterium sp. NFXW15 TaxID=2819512 RepID=UPI003CF9F688